MKARIFSRRLCFLLSMVAIAGCAAAHPATEYQPKIGQEGKDIVWLPTAQVLTERMLDTQHDQLAKLDGHSLKSVAIINFDLRRSMHCNHR